MNNDYTKKLLEAIKCHKPLKIYLDNTYYDTFEYSNNFYRGQFGKISIQDIIKKIKNDSDLSFIKIEVAE